MEWQWLGIALNQPITGDVSDIVADVSITKAMRGVDAKGFN